MKNIIIYTLILISIFSFSTPSVSQTQKDNWVPTGVWPFLNQRFRVATVVAGYVRPTKTQVPCNIHIGRQTLYYAKDDTLMEATPGSIVRVEFPDAVYIPIGQQTFGKIIHEDSIGKIIRVREINWEEFEGRKDDVSNMGSFTLLSNGLSPELNIDFIGQYIAHPEEEPLPIKDTFFFYFNGNLFEANTTNILSNIDQDRRKEYRAYTRSAEILSTSETSMRRIWNDFFVDFKGEKSPEVKKRKEKENRKARK